jgi:Uma2 family endonuclease
MRTAINDKIYTVEEYIEEELHSEVRHEFINGQLYEMAGGKDINNELALIIATLFKSLLKMKGYMVYTHELKVAIPGRTKYYYPDAFVTRK